MIIHRASDAKSIELSDPRSLRALAHPVRLQLIKLLRMHGPLTATLAAELTGESAGTCSFHFRQLAKWGFVEEAGGGKGRERPWRATASVTTWSNDGEAAESREAAHLLNGVLAERYAADLLDWHQRSGLEDLEWRAAAHTGDVVLRLTSAELVQLNRDLRAVLERWNEKTASRPPTEAMRFVQFVSWTYPLPPSQLDQHEDE